MTSYLAFVGVAAGTVLLPGPDMLVVLRTALAAGTRSGVWAALGSGTGNLLWGTATVLGVTAVLAASPAAFAALKLARRRLPRLAGRSGPRAPHGGATCWPTPIPPSRPPPPGARSGAASRAISPTSRSGSSGPRSCRSSSSRAPAPLPAAAMVLTMALLCFAGMGAFAVVAGRLRPALARPLASRVVNALVGVLLMALAAGLAVAH